MDRHRNFRGGADMTPMTRWRTWCLRSMLAWSGFAVALLGIDAFFIAVFSFHEIYIAFYNENLPLLGDEWNIEGDRSYAEIYSVISSLR